MDSTITRCKKKNLLGEMLVSSGRIRPEQLNRALALKKDLGLKIGQALVELGFISEIELSEALRKQGKLLCINLDPDIIEEDAARLLGEEPSRRLNSIVINRIAGISTVAMGDPTDLYSVDEIAMRVKTRILPVHAQPDKIERCLNLLFGSAEQDGSMLEDLAASLDEDGSTVSFSESTQEEVTTDEDLDKPVINMVRSLIQEAFRTQASDIHLEARQNGFVARFRIDGVLHERLSVSKAWARPCIARLKVLARLDLAQTRLPQDGRAQAMIEGQPVDLRIATTPSLYGEGAVIRLLKGGKDFRSVNTLEMSEQQLQNLHCFLGHRDGFVLATGPTGSGKTTTLYALLQEQNTPDRKIITLEDPVEYQLPGVSQIHVHPKIGLTFAKGFRSILRQDPDIVLVGEIRDEETARIAVQAALTGHLVLSTIHTIGTTETITRLLDMGVEKYLLADSLRGIIAQRLLRRICPNCKRPIKVGSDVLDRLGIKGEGHTVYEGEGCEFCNGTGYKGRMALYEILYITPKIRTLIHQNKNSEELRTAARNEGTETLRMDAARKVLAGFTSVSEALSATGS